MDASSANSTPAGTYTLTVTGTSGSLPQTTQVTLKVQFAAQRARLVASRPWLGYLRLSIVQTKLEA